MPMILSYWHPLLLHFVFCFPSVNAFPGTQNLISTHLRHNLYVSVLIVLPDGMFCFFGQILSFSDCVHHLGHVLSFNLDDSEDINRVSMDMSRKANYLLHSFKSCSPLVKTFLFTSHCLSLYGAVSWFLCSKQIKCLEATFNNVLRKIWNLPKLFSVIPGFYIVSPVFRVCITLLFINFIFICFWQSN